MRRRTTGWVLGIDLGTTNTAAVAYGPDDPTPISILHGRDQAVLPSVVSLKNRRMPLVGWLAKDMMLTDPATTIYGWKRFLGRPERSEYVQRYRDRFPYTVAAGPNGALGAVVSGECVPFTEIAALVLDQVRLQACAALGVDVRDCVISVPAHFLKAQRDAVLQASEAAGLHVMQLISEPAAAALAFGTEQGLDNRILIFDFGGGTFDATVIELIDNIFDVKATRGDGFLGGIDMDRTLLNRLVEHCESMLKIDLQEALVVQQRILNAAEAAKCALSVESETRVHVPMIGYNRRGKQVDLDYKLTRRELESLTAPLVERTIGIVEEMLASAQFTVQSIDHVVMVGGQSRMPLMRQRLEHALGRVPLLHLDPDTCVAQGAALVARGQHDLGAAVLLEVLSVPVGIVFPGGRTQFLFAANTALPARVHVPLERPVDPAGLVVGLWQGPDIASAERQTLGIIRVPRALFDGAENCGLVMSLEPNMEIRAQFTTTTKVVPLPLEMVND
jgi:molecular chaperone DnaK